MNQAKKISTFDLATYEQLEKSLNNIKIHKLNSNKPLKVYVASPWFDEKAKCLLDFVKHQSTFCTDYKFYFPYEHQYNSPYETFLADCVNIDNADFVLALISRKDVGTAFELGYAKAKNKTIILLCYDETDFENGTNIMLAYCSNVIISIPEFIPYFTGKTCAGIHIKNNWEGKE